MTRPRPSRHYSPHPNAGGKRYRFGGVQRQAGDRPGGMRPDMQVAP